MVETYSTVNVRRGSKVAYWNELHCRMLFPLEVRPENRNEFDADVSIAGFAGALFAKVNSSPATIERTAGHVAGTEERFTLLMSMKGSLQLAHYGHDVLLEEGDFSLCDSRVPSRMSYVEEGVHQTLAVTAPTKILRAYLPLPESMCGLRVIASRGAGRMLPSMFRCLWVQAAEGIPDEIGKPLISGLLNVAATAYAMEYGAAVDDSAVRSARKSQIKRFIEAHLRDPDLSVGAIATATGMSPRYVHRVFADEGESILAYVLRRRLEECAQQLSSLLWQGHTATNIAFEWGFVTAAHFSRAFKLQFGMTPNEYRGRKASPPAQH